MEDIFSKFSHLGEQIFVILNNESIEKSKKVTRSWNMYLEEQKFLEIRRIEATVEKFHTLGDAWKRFFKTATTETIMNLGYAISIFYVSSPDLKYHEGLTPLHVAAATGQLTLLQK